MTEPRPSVDACTVTVHVPIAIRRRGGRKLVLAPDGAEIAATPVTRHVDNAMVKAIARAFRWRDMLESGQYATIREIAAAENISETYVGRTLRLTLLAPSIVDAILDGQQAGLQLNHVMTSFPIDWQAQSKALDNRATRVHLVHRPSRQPDVNREGFPDPIAQCS